MRTIIMLVILCMTLSVHGQNKLTGMEYWFDQQHSSRIFLSLPGTNEYFSTIQNLAVGTVAAGYHTLNLRLRDTEGIWSSVKSQRVYIHPQSENKINRLRIWSDPTSNPSDLFVLPINPEVKYLYITQVLDLCQLDNTGSIRVFFQLGDNNGNWSSVTSKTINVDIVGMPPATIGDIIGPEFVCFNANQNYSVNSVQGASNYHWNAPANWQPTTSFDTLSILPDHMDGLISIYASNACGNSNVVNISVSVNDSIPSIPVITEGPTSVCEGTEYHYAVIPEEDVNEYSWSFPTNWTVQSVVSDSERTVIPGIISGDITVSASNACGTSEATLEVNVTPHVPLNQFPIQGTSYGCVDSILTFSIPEDPLADTYNWQYPTEWGSPDTINDSILVVSPTSTSGNINISLENVCGVSDTLSLHINISDSPPSLADSIHGEKNLCFGDTVNLSVLSSGDVQSYAWQFPYGWEILSNPDSNAVTVKVGDSEQSILVNAENSCGISNSSIYSPDVTRIDTAVFRNGDTLIALFPNAMYQWINCFNSNEIAGATQKTFVPLSSGQYKVRIEQNGCTALSSCYDIIISGIENENHLPFNVVFPNPFVDQFFVRGIFQSDDEISLLNVLGRRASFTMIRQDDGVYIHMNSDSPSGVYFVVIQTAGSRLTLPIVKS